MIYLILGILLLGGIVWAGNWFLTSNPQVLARTLKLGAATVLLVLAVLFLIGGRIGLAIGAGAVAFGLLGWRARGDSIPQAGQHSTVRAAFVEMDLDHDSGEILGRVLSGRFSGRQLAELSTEELRDLWVEVAQDPESLALVEAYLDRRHATWREDFQSDPADGHGGATSSGSMTDKEAYEILGLAPGAGKAEIRAAHRRLMKVVHPDRGGSPFLAAKLNEAKDLLLRGH